jgi:hypothetical protein
LNGLFDGASAVTSIADNVLTLTGGSTLLRFKGKPLNACYRPPRIQSRNYSTTSVRGTLNPVGGVEGFAAIAFDDAS